MVLIAGGGHDVLCCCGRLHCSSWCCNCSMPLFVAFLQPIQVPPLASRVPARFKSIVTSFFRDHLSWAVPNTSVLVFKIWIESAGLKTVVSIVSPGLKSTMRRRDSEADVRAITQPDNNMQQCSVCGGRLLGSHCFLLIDLLQAS
jgi:hypothetical protein